MKRMLFNATQAEELRVAIVDGQKLIDLDIETVGKEQRKSNIYKGVITRIEPSLEAAFVDYGQERHGFLPFKEVARSYFLPGTDHRARIQDALKEGMEVIVQVDKDERGNKGAALTTFISLAGRYLVLMPNNPRGGGVSRRIEGEERNELRALLDQLESPNGMSVIGRTAAIGRNLEELQWDLNYLLQLWSAVEGAAHAQSGAFLIYQESSLVIRAIRDYFQPEIGEILIDTETLYEQARQFMSHVMPGNVNRVKLYKDDVPLFSRFQIEHQIETAYRREVSLPSGGAIVIDHTEALVSIDVNSARATRGGDIETTALNTNLEAADEIARQLRLRDLGGLIVIDFIDMENPKNQREVENRLKDALHHDRARVQYGKISRFGLLELSRQRLQPSLGESAHMPCPRCHGTGFIRGTESSALHILRILQEEAMKENTGAVHAQVPVDVATFLLNEKRAEIYAIEARLKVNVVLIPNTHLETPNYKINRLRHDDLNHTDDDLPSYKLMERPSEDVEAPVSQKQKVEARQQAAVQHFAPDQPAPVMADRAPRATASAAATPQKPGFFARIINWLKGETAAIQETKPVAKQAEPARRGRNNGERNNRNGRGERGDRNNRGERGERGERENQNAGGRNNRQDENRNRQNDENRANKGEEGNNRRREPRAEQNTDRENAGSGNNRNRNNRQDRENRDQKQQQQQQEAANAKVAIDETAIAQGNEAGQAQQDQEGRTGSRRRRNRRGDRKDRPAEGTTANVQASGNEAPEVQAAEAPAPVVAAPVVKAVTETVAAEPAKAAEVVVSEVTAEVVAVPAEAPAPVVVKAEPVAMPAPVVVDETPVVTEVPVAVAVPVAEVVAETPAVTEAAAPVAEEVVTVASTVAAEAVVAEEAPAKPRRTTTRRRPQKPAEPVAESLQLVETDTAKKVEVVEEVVVVPVAKPKTPRRRPRQPKAEQDTTLQQVETQAGDDA
ncbi:Rne/Rng family ribonuclease [Leeia oryzae]|uniref:Rne/Rng family ribonuclease n=1 Tax=Leeia oryzae TaxID=356662 RepID=UPI0005265986|nr:Rne/Rng family ribonuclease [Leeia oryzae]